MFYNYVKTILILSFLIYSMNYGLAAQGLCGPQTDIPAEMRYDPQGAEGDNFNTGFAPTGGTVITQDFYAVPVSESGVVVGCAEQATEVDDNGTPRFVFNNIFITRSEDCYAPDPFGGQPSPTFVQACNADVGQQEGLTVLDESGTGNYEGFFFVLYSPANGGEFYPVSDGGLPFSGTDISQGFFGGSSNDLPPAPGVGGVPASDVNVPGPPLASFAAAIASLQALPVELVQFTGSFTGKSVRLNWATASESENAGFDIERMGSDGSFSAIGQVAGEGNSSVYQSYDFTDADPLPGVNYYRLRQVDFGGAFSLSSIVSVATSGLATPSISVFPNPVSGPLSVRLEGGWEARRVRVIAGSGRVVIDRAVQTGESRVELDLTSLRAGIYQVAISDGDVVVTERIVVE